MSGTHRAGSGRASFFAVLLAAVVLLIIAIVILAGIQLGADVLADQIANIGESWDGSGE